MAKRRWKLPCPIRPTLILSDIMMPRLDGFGLLGKLRAEAVTRTIPVILLSARAGEESRVEGLGAGADDYLVKPFTARELLARVAAHLSMRRRREEAQEALRESQATLQSFYDSSSFLMGVSNSRAKISSPSTATRRRRPSSVRMWIAFEARPGRSLEFRARLTTFGFGIIGKARQRVKPFSSNMSTPRMGENSG